MTYPNINWVQIITDNDAMSKVLREQPDPKAYLQKEVVIIAKKPGVYDANTICQLTGLDGGLAFLQTENGTNIKIDTAYIVPLELIPPEWIQKAIDQEIQQLQQVSKSITECQEFGLGYTQTNISKLEKAKAILKITNQTELPKEKFVELVTAI